MIGSPEARFLRDASTRVGPAPIFLSVGNYVGVALETAQAGDEVWVLLGCNVSLLLRPRGEGRFRIVCPCFVPDIGEGETFLGPLLKNIRACVIYNNNHETRYRGFINVQSGEAFYEDPRLKSLPLPPGRLAGFRRRLSTHPSAIIHV